MTDDAILERGRQSIDQALVASAPLIPFQPAVQPAQSNHLSKPAVQPAVQLAGCPSTTL